MSEDNHIIWDRSYNITIQTGHISYSWCSLQCCSHIYYHCHSFAHYHCRSRHPVSTRIIIATASLVTDHIRNFNPSPDQKSWNIQPYDAVNSIIWKPFTYISVSCNRRKELPTMTRMAWNHLKTESKINDKTTTRNRSTTWC